MGIGGKCIQSLNVWFSVKNVKKFTLKTKFTRQKNHKIIQKQAYKKNWTSISHYKIT